MPLHRQGSVGRYLGAATAPFGVTPIAGARAGTVNDAGGLKTNIDARGYKGGTLRMYTGVLGTSCDAKVQDATASGGTYADMTAAANGSNGTVATGVAGEIHSIDFYINPARPWLQIVHVQVGATCVGCSWVELWGQATDRP